MLTNLCKNEHYSVKARCHHGRMAKTKRKKESDKALLASVTKEMAQPRVAESAQIEAHRQRAAKVRKPV
jgi:hypothetical protein